MHKDIIKNAAVNASLTALYVFLVASFLFYVPKVLGIEGDNNTVLIPVLMLLLLVFSVALVGVLIFGRPLLWYLDGKKKDAISLLFYTLVIFLLIIAVLFLLLFILTAGF